LLVTLAIIKANPGIQRKELVSKTGKGDATIGRHLATLAQKNLIEHKGSKRTGGYYAK
jgi:ATP-dependent DNA helicase RecG